MRTLNPNAASAETNAAPIPEVVPVTTAQALPDLLYLALNDERDPTRTAGRITEVKKEYAQRIATLAAK
jgi:hypothetical protein